MALSVRALNIITVLLTSATSDSSSVQEDALLALSALIEGMREQAAAIISYVKDLLLKAVTNVQHGQVSLALRKTKTSAEPPPCGFHLFGFIFLPCPCRPDVLRCRGSSFGSFPSFGQGGHALRP